jgi:hypothetical protein
MARLTPFTPRARSRWIRRSATTPGDSSKNRPFRRPNQPQHGSTRDHWPGRGDPPARACGRLQGWLDIQMVLALIFLNLAGGDCVEDLERLETDSGFAAVLRVIERDVLSCSERHC